MKKNFDANWDSIRNLVCIWDRLYLYFSISRSYKVHHKKQSLSLKNNSVYLVLNWNKKLEYFHYDDCYLISESINKICTYLWLVHKNGLDAVANHWTWSQSWSLLYRRPASFLILIQVLKWSPYALNSWVISWVMRLNSLQLKTFFTLLTSSCHRTTNPESTNSVFFFTKFSVCFDQLKIFIWWLK